MKKVYYIRHDNSETERKLFEFDDIKNLDMFTKVIYKESGQFTKDELLILKLKGLRFVGNFYGVLPI